LNNIVVVKIEVFNFRFLAKFSIFYKIFDFLQNLRFFTKSFFTQLSIFTQISMFYKIFYFLQKISIFYKIFHFLHNFRFLSKISMTSFSADEIYNFRMFEHVLTWYVSFQLSYADPDDIFAEPFSPVRFNDRVKICPPSK